MRDRRRVAAAGLAATMIVLWAASAETMWQRFILDCALGWTLLGLAWIDWRSLRLPDALTLPLLVLGIVLAWLDSSEALLSSVVGALAGYGSLVLVGLSYRRVRRREGLGLGDAKLLAAGGAWLGWAALPWVVLLGAFFGLALALLYRARGAPLTSQTALPFGPPLALAIWITRLYGVPLG